MEKIGRSALQGMRIFMVACLAIMVVLVFGNVVLRYGFNSGISISEEASRYLFVWLTFIGAVVAMQEHSHLGVDTLISRLPLTGKKVCAIASDVLMLGCSALLLIGSWKQAGLNMDNAAPVSGMPVGLMYLAGVVASIGMIAVIGAHLWRVLSGRADAHDLIQVAESEEPMPQAAVKGAQP